MDCERIEALIHTVNPYGVGVEIDMEEGNRSLFERIFALAECIGTVNPKSRDKDRFVWIRGCAKQKEEWHGLFLANRNGNRAIFLDNTMLIDTRAKTDKRMDMSEFMEWLIEELEWCIDMLNMNTYNAYIRENLSYEHRAGIIRRSKYWHYVPRDKERTLGMLDESKKREFITWFERCKNNTGYGIKDMTSGLYYETCNFLYDLFGMQEQEAMTPIERYRKYADGRDNGLMELDVNSTEQFENWYAGGFADHAWDYYESKRTSLRVFKREDGFYFHFHYRTDGETIPYVLELIRYGCPLYVPYYKEMVQRIEGTDMVAISPQRCGLTYYKKWSDDIRQMGDIKYLPTEYPLELLSAIEWYEIPEIHLI